MSYFLGSFKSPSYQEDVVELLDAYKEMGCRMSLKMYFLHSNLEFFPGNLEVNIEKGERFHQDIQTMKERYQGFWNKGIMGNFCWMLYRDHPTHA